MPKVPKVESRWKKKPATIALVVIVLLVVGGIIWGLSQQRQGSPASKVDDALAQSQQAYQQGDFEAALKAVNDIDKQATSDTQKAQIYQAAAQAAMSNGKWEDTVKYYELKHHADPSSIGADAYSMGAAYQLLGQKDKALAQFKIALEFAKKQQNEYSSDVPAIEAAIKEAEGR